MLLRFVYTLAVPFYDALVDKSSRQVRAESCRELQELTRPGGRILIAGIGTGLDIPHLPPDRQYVGVDITPGMLRRASRQRGPAPVALQVADVMHLPFPDAAFDAIVLHLILAVAPDSSRTLREAERVLVPGGHIVIVDKFLRVGQRATLRRLINPLFRRFASQTSVEFEPLLGQCPSLEVVSDQGVLLGGYFRRIVLRRQGRYGTEG